ncbi:mannosyltransferase [Mucidula mucida]|nr:mannosyltransferase [Mucidula mucida]
MPACMAPLRVAFIHPDLGIGGAERLVVDAALGLQKLGHSVDIYTSHHDPSHCFEETRDGTLNVHGIHPPFPRSIRGKLHILLAHATQLHLTTHILRPSAPKYDVFFVDQLSTCVPLLQMIGKTRVVFYCHFPDKLLANGAFVHGQMKMRGSLLKRLYRMPMDWLEELTTRQSDVILANSNFTASVFKAYFPSIPVNPRVVYPGINIEVYEAPVNFNDPEISRVVSSRSTFISLNRFEKKKNAALAVSSFALAFSSLSDRPRLVLAGGYDPRVEDNMLTLYSLIDLAKSHSLSYNDNPDVLFLLNFTTAQRTALLSSPSTRAFLYTPANEHFGIGPVEGMIGGVPVLACDSGGPVESVVDDPPEVRTGWLRAPEVELWAEALKEINALTEDERAALSSRAKDRARTKFGMDAMAKDIDQALHEAVDMGPTGLGLFAKILLAFPIVYIILHLILSFPK